MISRLLGVPVFGGAEITPFEPDPVCTGVGKQRDAILFSSAGPTGLQFATSSAESIRRAGLPVLCRL